MLFIHMRGMQGQACRRSRTHPVFSCGEVGVRCVGTHAALRWSSWSAQAGSGTWPGEVLAGAPLWALQQEVPQLTTIEAALDSFTQAR